MSCVGGGLTDDLILCVVGLNLVGGGGKIKVPSKTPTIFLWSSPYQISHYIHKCIRIDNYLWYVQY